MNNKQSLHVETTEDGYDYLIGRSIVKVLFSADESAPDLEDLLVKIAGRKRG